MDGVDRRDVTVHGQDLSRRQRSSRSFCGTAVYIGKGNLCAAVSQQRRRRRAEPASRTGEEYDLAVQRVGLLTSTSHHETLSAVSDSLLAVAGEERRGDRRELLVVLEDATVPGVGIDDQFRSRDAPV